MPKPKVVLPVVAFGGLLQDTTPGTALAGARSLPLALVDANPAQSRQVFDETALAELADSIRLHGVLEPILVRPVGPRFQVVAGERRTRAARAAGLTEIPALIRELTDADAAYVTAIENLQREDLDIEDEARQYQKLLEVTGLSQRKLAEQLGVNHVYLSRRVKLLGRPDLMQAYRAGQVQLHDAVAQVDTDPPPMLFPPETRRPADSTPQPDPLPRFVERAALDSAQRATRNAPPDSRVPYRARALDSAATTFLRMDWASVPAGERATVAAQLELIEQAAREARAALTANGGD